MKADTFSREESQEIILQLEQALYNLTQWHASIVRSLVCQLPADRHDLRQDAHKECRFGQWYYEIASKKLREHAGFIALGEEHVKMHQEAAKLLTTVSHGGKVRPYDYDNFANALQRVQLEISSILRELHELLYSRDPLTGAINRVNMLPILWEQQALVKRNIECCSIAMLDLDHFKKINDKHGHAAGDHVLAWLSNFIIDHLRIYDKIFRVGGEEFLICLPNIDTKLAAEILDHLREKITSSKFNLADRVAIKINISVGISAIEADASIEQSIERADQALYQAKHEGRNCIRVWHE